MQSAPSNKIYAQALEKIRDLTRRYSSLQTRSVDEISGEVSKTIKELKEDLNGPLFRYSEIEYGEVPDSFKMNKFLQDLAYDVNVVMDESDIVRAASIYTHNFIKTEILKSERQNERLHNKIKTLQMYSRHEDSSIIYVGDSFYNDEYIDWGKISPSERVEVVKGQWVSLGISEKINSFSPGGSIEILSGSNGFIGNNQEILDLDSVEDIVFKSEDNTESNPSKLAKILDNEPNTVFEFEKYYLDPSETSIAKGFNFSYKVSGEPETSYLVDQAGENGEIKWSDGLVNDELKLNLLIDLGAAKKVNLINLNPYGLPDNINGPFLIKSVMISENKTDWFTLGERNVWVANGIDQNTVNLDSENIQIGNAAFNVDGVKVRYINFEISQTNSLQTKVGHVYYTSKNGEQNQNGGLTRFEGPVPSVDSIWKEKEVRSSYQNNLVQRRESFDAQRWVIGLRDISVFSTVYKQTSKLVSTKFFVPGGVDRVSLEANVIIPDGYATDIAWVRFYISPDDGNSWHQISRIQDDFFGVPEIIAYNDNTPVELRIPGIKYYEASETPTSLRVKVEIDRNADDNTLTPIVRDYRIKVKQRNSL